VAFLASGFGLAAVGLATAWQQLESEAVLVWSLTMIGVSVAATAVTRFRENQPRLAAWTDPLHLAVFGAGVIAMFYAAEFLAADDARLVGAGLLAVAGVHLLANRSWVELFDPENVSAAISLVAAAALAVSVLDRNDRWSIAVLVGLAVLGMAASAFAGMGDRSHRIAWSMVAGGWSLVALIGAVALFDVLSGEVAYVLLVVGGACAAFALTARELLAFHAAVASWLAALLILINERWELELHATIVAVAVVLLIMMEVERFRRRRQGIEIPEWLGAAEWAVMVTPPALAVYEMVVTSLLYGVVLAVEGGALIVWGGLTRVRRRALVGLIAVTAAIILAPAIPLIRGSSGRLTGGTWLVLGAIAAALFIITGALIERYRARIGRRLAAWGEILETWE
jgi:hypothetical protein